MSPKNQPKTNGGSLAVGFSAGIYIEISIIQFMPNLIIRIKVHPQKTIFNCIGTMLIILYNTVDIAKIFNECKIT